MHFDSNLDLRSLPMQDAWCVLRPLQLHLDDGRMIVVPIGYVTDLASVPRIAWRIVPRDYSPARAPAVVHDFIYTNLTHRFTKAEADQIFYDALLEQGTPKVLAWLMWCAVRIGGRGNWGH